MNEEEKDMAEAIMDTETAAFMSRSKKPVVWCRLPFGIRIEDLQQPYYEEVVDLVKRHYVPDEPTFASVKMAQDEASMEEFVSLCNVWIRDTYSLVAIEEGEKKAVGALIGRVCLKKDMNYEYSMLEEMPDYEPSSPKMNHMSSIKVIKKRMSSKKSIKGPSAKKKTGRRQTSGMGGHKSKKGTKKRRLSSRGRSTSSAGCGRVFKFERPVDLIPKQKKTWKPVAVFYDEELTYKTEPLRKVHTVKHFISKKFDIFESLSKSKYYKVYMMVIHREYRRRGIGKTLLKCLFNMCRGYRIEVAAGVFPTFLSQNMFFKMGGKVGYEMTYEDYMGQVAGDDTIALMYLAVPSFDNGRYVEKTKERRPITLTRDAQGYSL